MPQTPCMNIHVCQGCPPCPNPLCEYLYVLRIIRQSTMPRTSCLSICVCQGYPDHLEAPFYLDHLDQSKDTLTSLSECPHTLSTPKLSHYSQGCPLCFQSDLGILSVCGYSNRAVRYNMTSKVNLGFIHKCWLSCMWHAMCNKTMKSTSTCSMYDVILRLPSRFTVTCHSCYIATCQVIISLLPTRYIATLYVVI